MLFFQQFDLEVVCKPGKQHTNADSLSRVSSGEVADATDPASPVTTTVAAIPVATPKPPAIAFNVQTQDPALAKVIELLTEEKPQQGSDIGFKQAYLYFVETLLTLLPKPLMFKLWYHAVAMQEMVLTHLHNQSGHLGIHKTMEKVKSRYYWPGYESDIEKWVRECEECQRRNPPPSKPRADNHSELSIREDHHGHNGAPSDVRERKFIYISGD